MGRHTGLGAVLAIMLLAPSQGDAVGDAEVRAAREELRLRIETERRMRHDFESLLASGGMTASEIADFEHYLTGLGELVDQQRRVVARFEGGDSERGTQQPASAELPEDFNRGRTGEEKIAMMDAELGSSLSAFDDKLLREQEELAEKSRASATGDDGARNGAREGAANGGRKGQQQGAEGQAGEGSGGQGGGSDSRGVEAGSGSGQKDGAQGEADSQGEVVGEGAEGSDQVASAGGPGDAGAHSGKTGVPPDIPDGKDDDVVARQLREAAENEQDPELRDKLWDEYRRYKSSTQ